MEQTFGQGYSNIDNKIDPTPYIKYLEMANKIKGIQESQSQALDFLNIQKGKSYLEVGCGIGDNTSKMAELVGKEGQVTGVDISETFIKIAQERHSGKKLPLTFMGGDIQNLNFPDKSFSGCRVDRTLQHIKHFEKAISELIRVTKKNGNVVVLEPDWGTLLVNSNNRELTRKIFSYICDSAMHGWIGRIIPSFLKKQGLVEIEVSTVNVIIQNFQDFEKLIKLDSYLENAKKAKIATNNEMEEWLKYLLQENKEKRFLGSLTFFISKGKKTT